MSETVVVSARSSMNQWATDLTDLLNELGDVQQSMLDVLAKKRDYMAASDAEGMTSLQPLEEQLCERLQSCHDRRAVLLESAKQQGLPAESIGRLAEMMPGDSRDALTQQVRETQSRIRILQHQSLTNWVLAQRTLIHISQLIEIIATGGRIQPTYGEGASAHCSGSLVDREA